VGKKGGVILLNSAVIIPTGDEIFNGIVIDTNSPVIMQLILEAYPRCEVRRLMPVIDNEIEIIEKIKECLNRNVDLIILIGGSGGGHRYVPTLGKDFTHSAILKYLKDYKYKEIYGKNGHMWSKLIAAKKDNTLVINVPGPYVEAIEATKACINCLVNDEKDLTIIVEKIAEAVLSKYPTN